MTELKTLDDIKREFSSIESTDKLIELNKRYEKLSSVYDSYETLIDELDQFEEFEADVNKIRKLQDAVYKKMREVWSEANNLVLFQRLGKAALIQKALKD